jgi:3-oxoacyl-[acyl-carrier protein] reductase
MDFGLKGKTALVLGGGGGLGRAIAKSLAGEGTNVAVAGIRADSIHATLAELEEIGGKALSLIWDLRGPIRDRREHLEDRSRTRLRRHPRSTTPGGRPQAPPPAWIPALWANQFQAMVLSVIAITDRVLPGMKSRGWGRILTSTSSGVISPIPNLAISNALRLSLVGWSKTLAREVGKDGITANIVVPGRRVRRCRGFSRQRARRIHHRFRHPSRWRDDHQHLIPALQEQTTTNGIG